MGPATAAGRAGGCRRGGGGTAYGVPGGRRAASAGADEGTRVLFSPVPDPAALHVPGRAAAERQQEDGPAGADRAGAEAAGGLSRFSDASARSAQLRRQPAASASRRTP